jgi:Ca2+-transporting ATPase
MVLAVYLITMGRGDDLARTVSFTTMIIANLSLILTNRSWSNTIFQTIKTPNKALWWVLTGALVFLGLVIYFAPLQQLFRFCPLSTGDIILCIVAGTLSVVWFEVLKWLKGYTEIRIQL